MKRQFHKDETIGTSQSSEQEVGIPVSSAATAKGKKEKGNKREKD